mgnify:FL=1
MHLQRSIIDPLDDTAHMITFAEQRAAELDGFIEELPGAASAAVGDADGSAVAGNRTISVAQVEDADIPPQFREVFIEESEEIVAELTELTAAWRDDPQAENFLRDIRRHFHTFKGNGRAVGANVLGELGWAAQDMLDRVLDGELMPHDGVMSLVGEVVEALPDLVGSYQSTEGPDLDRIRHLTAECFRRAEGGQDALADKFGDTHETPAPQPESAAIAATVTHG